MKRVPQDQLHRDLSLPRRKSGVLPHSGRRFFGADRFDPFIDDGSKTASNLEVLGPGPNAKRPRREVPDARRPVPRSRHQGPTVGAECRSPNRVPVSPDANHFGKTFGVEDAERRIRSADEKPCSIRRVLETPRLVELSLHRSGFTPIIEVPDENSRVQRTRRELPLVRMKADVRDRALVAYSGGSQSLRVREIPGIETPDLSFVSSEVESIVPRIELHGDPTVHHADIGCRDRLESLGVDQLEDVGSTEDGDQLRVLRERESRYELPLHLPRPNLVPRQRIDQPELARSLTLLDKGEPPAVGKRGEILKMS